MVRTLTKVQKATEIKNVDDTIKRIRGAIKLVFRSLNTETALQAKRLMFEVKDRAPVGDTGRLKEQVTFQKVFAPKNIIRYSVFVPDERKNPDSRGFVARFIELGTSKMDRMPFIRPAGDALQDPILDELTQTLKETLKGRQELGRRRR